MADKETDFGPMFVMSDRHFVVELFEKCSKTDMRVIGCILKHMSWDNNMLPETQRSIQKALAASSRGKAPSVSSVNESFRFLQGHPKKPSSKGDAGDGLALSQPLLVLTGGGNYMINPSYFRKGDKDKRKRLEARWSNYRNARDHGDVKVEVAGEANVQSAPPDIYDRLSASGPLL